MYGYLYKYLVLYKKLALPGIGQFTIDEVPSRIDFVNKRLYPYMPVIRFAQGSPMADKVFYNFITQGLNVDDLEAIQKFNELIFHIKEQFTLNGFADLPGIGRLTKQFANTYTFKPLAVPQFYPDLHNERVIRKNAPHTIKIGEDEVSSITKEETAAEEAKEKNWKIYALALALIAAMAIAYYYLTK